MELLAFKRSAFFKHWRIQKTTMIGKMMILDVDAPVVIAQKERLPTKHPDQFKKRQEAALGKKEGEILKAEPSSMSALFEDYEKHAITNEPVSQITPSPVILEAHQRAEIQANDYMRRHKIDIQKDPFKYWDLLKNSSDIDCSLLLKLVNRLHCVPATSAECERLFSIAGKIVTDLRKRLLPENLENLLFLHHNLKNFDFRYD
ncbi:zinc finger BED domain-containing protein 1-like [Ditylenchus destructor]|nr:zinc finger BED domain-containing protein 1-like [Ditylenchus destructor]